MTGTPASVNWTVGRPTTMLAGLRTDRTNAGAGGLRLSSTPSPARCSSMSGAWRRSGRWPAPDIRGPLPPATSSESGCCGRRHSPSRCRRCEWPEGSARERAIPPKWRARQTPVTGSWSVGIFAAQKRRSSQLEGWSETARVWRNPVRLDDVGSSKSVSNHLRARVRVLGPLFTAAPARSLLSAGCGSTSSPSAKT